MHIYIHTHIHSRQKEPYYSKTELYFYHKRALCLLHKITSAHIMTKRQTVIRASWPRIHIYTSFYISLSLYMSLSLACISHTHTNSRSLSLFLCFFFCLSLSDTHIMTKRQTVIRVMPQNTYLYTSLDPSLSLYISLSHAHNDDKANGHSGETP